MSKKHDNDDYFVPRVFGIVLFITAIFLIASFFFTGCGKECINEYDKTITGMVSNREYTPESQYQTTSYIQMGRMLIPHTNNHTSPAKYKVTITVDGFSKTFDDEALYNSYIIGDSIDMVVHYKEYNDGSVYKDAAVKEPVKTR